MTETTPEAREAERIAMALDGYAKAYDRLHRDIADDFRKGAALIRAAALSPPAISEAVEAEREACARIADMAPDDKIRHSEIAQAIRARTSISEVG